MNDIHDIAEIIPKAKNNPLIRHNKFLYLIAEIMPIGYFFEI